VRLYSPWWWRQDAALKRRSTLTRLHDAISQNAVVFYEISCAMIFLKVIRNKFTGICSGREWTIHILLYRQQHKGDKCNTRLSTLDIINNISFEFAAVSNSGFIYKTRSLSSSNNSLCWIGIKHRGTFSTANCKYNCILHFDVINSHTQTVDGTKGCPQNHLKFYAFKTVSKTRTDCHVEANSSQYFHNELSCPEEFMFVTVRIAGNSNSFNGNFIMCCSIFLMIT
jgi:hypothetical protein